MTQTLSSARKKLGEQASCLFVECTGRMPNATNFSFRQQGNGLQRDRQEWLSSFMRAGRPRSLLLLPSKERGHLARRSRDGSATLLPWERRRLAAVALASAFPGDKPFACNKLTPKIKTKQAAKN